MNRVSGLQIRVTKLKLQIGTQTNCIQNKRHSATPLSFRRYASPTQRSSSVILLTLLFSEREPTSSKVGDASTCLFHEISPALEKYIFSFE